VDDGVEVIDHRRNALSPVPSSRFESQLLAIDLVAYAIHLVLQCIRKRRDDFEVYLGTQAGYAVADDPAAVGSTDLKRHY
jgi:hypothetical protein